VTEVLLPALKLSVVVLTLGIGLSEPASDLLYTWRRPGLLLRSLLAMYVLVPLVALGLAKFLPLTLGAKAALLLLAVSAGAPLLPRRLATFGAVPYLFSLGFTSSVLAMAIVPLSFRALGAWFDVPVQTPAIEVALVIGKSILLPLGVGMGLRAVLPDRVREKALPLLTNGAGLALVAATLALLGSKLDLLLEARLSGVAARVVLMIIALATGHALGGPVPGERSALAIACATRHLGIALLVASTLPGRPRLVLLIGVYIVVSLAVTAPYLRWRKKALAAQRPA